MNDAQTPDNQTVEQLTATLPDLDDTALAALRDSEAQGEDRSTALDAIDAEIRRRASAAQKALEDQAALDGAAQVEGFADHAAKVDAEAAASRAAKAKRAKSVKPTVAQATVANERGLADAREAIDQGKGELLLVGFGDDRKPFKDIPFAQADMRSVGPRLVTGGDILMRTSKLTGTVTITHAWLIGGPDTLLARAELGAPMIVVPQQQIKIAAGRLAFTA